METKWTKQKVDFIRESSLCHLVAFKLDRAYAGSAVTSNRKIKWASHSVSCSYGKQTTEHCYLQACRVFFYICPAPVHKNPNTTHRDGNSQPQCPKEHLVLTCPYIHELMSGGIHLFMALKKALIGRHFGINQDVKKNAK